MGKVVELLGKLEKQVRTDGEKDAALFSASQKWYYKEVQTSTKTITLTKASISELTTALAMQFALRQSKKKGIESTAKALASAEADLKAAAERREKEHADFVKNAAALVDAIDTLGRALAVTKKQQPAGAAFVDEGGSDAVPAPTQSLSSVAKSLRRMFARSPDLSLTAYQLDTLDGFVRASAEQQEQQDDQSAPNFLQTRSSDQGVYGAYDVQIGGVGDTLKQLLDSSTKSRDDALATERKAKLAYQKFETPLMLEIGGKKSALAELKAQIAKSKEVTAQKRADLKTAKKLLANTEKYLEELHKLNGVKMRDYKARMDKRTDELLAIQEAIAILSSQAAKQFSKKQSIGSFDQEYIGLLQVSQSSRRSAIEMIRSAQNSGLVLMALKSQTHLMSKMRANPFTKVKRMIQQMLEKMVKEQAADAEKKAWCDSELANTLQSKKEKEHDVEKLKNRLAAMNAELAQLKTEIANLKLDVTEMMSALKTATDVRNNEKAMNLQAIKAYKDAQALVGDALKVLKEFYDQEAKLDSHSKTGKGEWKGATVADGNFQAGSGMASGIIGILEIAKQDFADLEKEVTTAEMAAAKDFKELKNESEVKLAVFTTDLEFKARKRIKLKGERTRLVADLKGYEKELAAVLAYYKKLKPMCTIQDDPYEVRAKRRQAELDALQNALTTLAGAR